MKSIMRIFNKAEKKSRRKASARAGFRRIREEHPGHPKKSKSKPLKMIPKRSKKYSTRDKATKIPDVIVVSSNRSKTRAVKTKEAAKERGGEVLSEATPRSNTVDRSSSSESSQHY
eukprot:537987_1